MADEEAEAGMGEFQGRRRDLPQPLEGPGQAGPLAVAVAEDGLDGRAQVAELLDREGGDEVAGVDDQVAAGVVEQADRLRGPGSGCRGCRRGCRSWAFPPDYTRTAIFAY